MKTQSSRVVSYIIPAILVLLLVASAIWLTPALAQNKKQAQQEPGKTKKVIIIDEHGNKTEYVDMDHLPSSIRATTDLAIAGSAMRLADDILREIDVPGITREITGTLASVRVSDITAQVDQALSEVDWNVVNYEVQRAMDEVKRELNDPEVRADVKESLRAAQEDLAAASAHAKRDLSRARRELREANGNLEQARATQERFDMSVNGNVGRMLDRMEDEGLIDRHDGFDVRKTDGRLYINGEEQSYNVQDTYDKYLGNGDISVAGKDNDVTVRMKK